ncbi:MAG: MalM family protein [Panacagrimonas sp.]
MLSLILAAAFVSGCAGPAATRASLPDPPRCGPSLKLGENAAIELESSNALVHRFDEASLCVREAGGSSAYAVFRLPRYRGPWVLTVESLIDGQVLFAPQLATLDSRGRVRRMLAFDRFSRRGDRLEASLFFNETDVDDHFLVVRSTESSVGKGERQVVSNTFFIPFLNTVLPFVYLQGVESEREITLARTGLVRLQARTGSAMRRQFDADGVARSELGKFVR